MNEQTFESLLLDLFDTLSYGDEVSSNSFPEFDQVETRTFEDCHLLTMNNGIILTLKDGNEFHLTIVQSRRAQDGKL